jgi:beta-glucosidase
MALTQLTFPKDFLWGAATASYQVEGAGHEGGRSECIWDIYARTPGNVYAGETGEIACDQYHRYKEDIALMAGLGFKAYRFSIAWPRIFPNDSPQGGTRVNSEGIAYYRSLCEELHKAGMKACATIYHWDLPQTLQDAGGWAWRGIVDFYLAYAQACFEGLGDVVDQWITMNEPYCVAYLGYLHGVHAPGIKDAEQAFRAVHHINLAHGRAVEAYRKTGLKAPIGTTLNLSFPRPATASEADTKAAFINRAFASDVFLYPILGKGYPEIVTKDFGVKFPIEAGDMETIAAPIDFIGVNYYNEGAVSWDDAAPTKNSGQPFWQDFSDMNWPVTPFGLKRLLEWLNRETGGRLPLYITENGYARKDEIEPDGRVHDKERIEYLKCHLETIATLVKDGLPLKGYFAWSLMDNFEWAWGYTRRFGIVHVDYITQKRTPKDSAYFFRDVMAGFGEW